MINLLSSDEDGFKPSQLRDFAVEAQLKTLAEEFHDANGRTRALESKQDADSRSLESQLPLLTNSQALFRDRTIAYKPVLENTMGKKSQDSLDQVKEIKSSAKNSKFGGLAERVSRRPGQETASRLRSS
ncbi:hypothetical protein MKZ38_002245 [Zalerion maritima]|uniref:Uncharacterized protein n=1 Tax=Zalerion maritima TaxID=339359 RepID=A0AAD5RP40_9PEZI|nr:hypothetical protein MKZ38_002245 [Zalerion maritima]